MPQYKSNVLIKFKNEPIPRVPSDYSKYKELHYQSWNLFEIYQNKISKLSEDEQNNLRTKFYEIFIMKIITYKLKKKREIIFILKV